MGLGELLRRYRKEGRRGDIPMRVVVAQFRLPPKNGAERKVNRQTIYTWEQPRSRPDPEDLRLYCVWLGCTEAEIAEALRLRSLPSQREVVAEQGAA